MLIESSRAIRNTANSPLLRIPRGLRNIIYDCAFSAPYTTNRIYPWPFWNPYNLVSASRQIYTETIDFYRGTAAMRPFETSVFEFDHDWQIAPFVTTLTRKQRRFVRKIRIPFDEVVSVDTHWNLIGMSGLRLVIVHSAPYHAGADVLTDAAAKIRDDERLPYLNVKFIRPLRESGLRGMRGLIISYKEDIEQETFFTRSGYPGGWSLAESNRVIDRV
ncbi:hypothetical protein K505DRAFT_358021 [Melanomma pulvis-pyrius CBS 109.77]|uniref:Uncharacterized protein n=1 Tax=Melanomma pulvis-pyrius CBS 109.77 TaxID=1314802 RepID=A0A6A6XMX7_9PLEO|nr:hypothetical protein K505DRAFT_358021 [Melanomma pulvis-pyrius CBS 109.77]